MPAPTSVLSVYANTSEMTEAQIIAASPALSAGAKAHRFLALPLHGDADLLSMEGRPHLQELIARRGRWLTWGQRALPVDATMATLNLASLNEACIRYESRLTIFFREKALTAKLAFERCCAAVVEAHPAEPDPDCSWAFSISTPSLAGVAALGQWTALCQVAVRDQQFRYRSRPLIALTLLDRYIWMLYCERESMEDIGEEVGLSRSAISRRLSKLPPRQRLEFRDGWREQFRASIDKSDAASANESEAA
mgnify:CR=1 FL=1